MKSLIHYVSILLISISLINSPLSSQSLNSPESQINNVKSRVLIYNIGFGFINGAVGVLIHEKKPTWKEIFLKGGLQGAGGGYLIHLGKTYLHKHSTSGKLRDYWISNSLFSVGNSAIVNASFNRKFYHRITFDYLFARVQIDIVKRRLGIGLNFSELLSNAAYALSHYDKYVLDFGSSLRYGVFISHPRTPKAMKGLLGLTSSHGGIKLNSNRIETGLYHRVLSHELLHNYQDLQYQVYSNWLNEVVSKLGFLLVQDDKSYPMRKVYFFTELFGPLVHDFVAYPLADFFSIPGEHYSNFFEMEARYYSRGGK